MKLESCSVASSLADSPPAPAAEQLSADRSAGEPVPAPGPPAPAPTPAPERTCTKCGAPLAAGQDWCLQCGAGAPGSLGTPSWRAAAIIIGASAILALAAVTAGYAALSKAPRKVRVSVAAVARSGVSPATTPATPQAALTPPKTLGTPTTIKPALPLTARKPPKIPLTAITPKPLIPKTTTTQATTTTGSAGTGTNTSTTTTTAPSSSASSGAGTSESQPEAILLDTDAASTYNPNAYPASDFGDPSLSIDGDTSTGWTALVEPALAPKMAVGLAIDLKSARKLSAAELITDTPGMTVELYAANGAALPASITAPQWVKLSSRLVVKSRHERIKLRDSTKAFRFVTLWISKAAAASVGTAQAPGHVSVNEIELFPAS